MPGMLPRRETSTLAAQERDESFRPSLSFMHRLRGVVDVPLRFSLTSPSG